MSSVRQIKSLRNKQTGRLYHWCPDGPQVLVDGCRSCQYFAGLDEKHGQSYVLKCTYYNPDVHDKVDFLEPARAKDTLKGKKGIEVAQLATHSWLERKFDGVRLLIYGRKGGAIIVSRRLDKTGTYSRLDQHLPHIANHPMFARDGVIFDAEGEMPPYGEHVTTLAATMSIIGSNPERAVAIQEEHGWMPVYLFDCMEADAIRLTGEPLRVRRRILEFVYDKQDPESLFNIVYLTKITVTTSPEQRIQMFKEATDRGEEGCILKDPDAVYGASGAWLKLKDKVEIDAQVIGWNRGVPGTKWENTLGTLKVAVIDAATGRLREIADPVPGNDVRRTWLYNTLKDLDQQQIVNLNLIVQVKAQGWSVNYRLRHPSTREIRHDRSEPNTVDFNEITRI